MNDFFHHDSDAFLFLVRLPIYSLHLTFKCWGCTVVVLFFFLLLTYLLLFSVFGSYYLMTRAKVLTFFYIYCMVLCKCDAREARDHGISSKYLSNSYYLFVDMVVAIAVVLFFSFFLFQHISLNTLLIEENRFSGYYDTKEIEENLNYSRLRLSGWILLS